MRKQSSRRSSGGACLQEPDSSCASKDIDTSTEHKLHYEIYYNELNLFYQKTTIFMTVQLALFSGLILKYEQLSNRPLVMLTSLLFLLSFSLIQFLVALRGYGVNNSLIACIRSFEETEGFAFLRNFENDVAKKRKIKRMNFPSYAMIIISGLFLVLWCIIFLFFAIHHLEGIRSVFFSVVNTLGELFTASSNIIICFLSAIFGILLAITMKIADMLDEHGMTLFKHADVIFGITWGIFGAALVLLSNVLANAMIAMMVGYVLRKRLDRSNHLIAFSIIVLSFVLWRHIEKLPLIILSACFTFLGMVKDLKYISSSSKLIGKINSFYRFVPIIYAFPSLIYSIASSKWEVFFGMFCFDFTYNIVRLISMKKTWYTDAT